MKKIKTILIVSLFLILLILVRVFQETLFYDPFIAFFKGNYLNSSLPDIDVLKYFIHIFFRYFINTTFSLCIIYLLFRNYDTLLFSVKFYIIVYMVLTIILLSLLMFDVNADKMMLFYIRRFLIQPIFLFILVPAFYYQQLKKKTTIVKK